MAADVAKQILIETRRGRNSQRSRAREALSDELCWESLVSLVG